MNFIKYFILIFLLFFFKNSNAEDWLTENYDIHLTCKLEKECAPGYDCAYLNDGYSQTLHFSLGADLDNWRKYKTCRYNMSLDILDRLPRDCYSDWMDDKSDGMWACLEDGYCDKMIVQSYGSNNLYAVNESDAFNLEVNEHNGTIKGKYGLIPSMGLIEYFIDYTRATLTMKWIRRCGSECDGAYLKDRRTFPLHQDGETQFFSCQQIQNKLF